MSPYQYYTERREESQAELKQLTARARTIAMLRLAVFLAIASSVYLLWGHLIPLLISVAIGIGLFIFLVGRYSDVKRRMSYQKQLVLINEAELESIAGNHQSFNTGAEFIKEEHPFNQDIDLFGEGSLFQLIDRTEIARGKQTLAYWLNSNDTDNITAKQSSVKELSQKADWRQHYKATAALIETEVDSGTILKWIHSYKAFVPKIFKWLPIVFSVISIISLIAYFSGFISGYAVGIWLGVGIAITGPYVKRVTALYNSAHQMQETFAQYAQLLEAIEGASFEAETLKRRQNNVQTDGIKASHRLKELAQEIEFLGNRNNLLFGFFANGFLLWDAFFTHRIETWMTDFDEALEEWFETIEYFDAMNSFANFAFNHPGYCYPQISTSERIQIDAKNLGHPLLNSSAMVTNNLSIHKEDFFIITGANMAGKSTFLRTVAVNLVLANCGLPVCAESFQYTPIKLISSMRTSDSLTNDESYFFAELKRLKYIVSAIESDDYFIILDEILKGTNSKDKAEGSQQFVERLVASHSTGLIATHDLSLCQLADKLPTVQNHYFDAEIVNDELHFDYTFKEGICQNMNASFLLKKMGIV